MGELVMTNGICNFIMFLKDLLKLKQYLDRISLEIVSFVKVAECFFC